VEDAAEPFVAIERVAKAVGTEQAVLVAPVMAAARAGEAIAQKLGRGRDQEKEWIRSALRGRPDTDVIDSFNPGSGWSSS